MLESMRTADNVFELYRLGRAISDLSASFEKKPDAELTIRDLLFHCIGVQPLIASIVADNFIPLDTCRSDAMNLKDRSMV
jgi:hypothetical protein